MKICISNNVSKTFKQKTLKSSSSADTNSAIDNKPSEFLPPDLTTSIESHNTSISTYMNNNKNNI